LPRLQTHRAAMQAPGMERMLGAEAPATAPFKAWDKQISGASTAAPASDFDRLISAPASDFDRLISDDQSDANELDPYEARGGLAAASAWQLPPGPRQEPLPALHRDDGFDLLEARGGMAAAMLQPRASQPDAYEARGGFAAKLAWQLAGPPAEAVAPPPQPKEVGLDPLEVRGGLAARLASGYCPDGHAGEPDVYETRGGMAEALSWQLPPARPPPAAAAAGARLGACKVDFYELRGGMADMLALQTCCA